MNIGFVGLGKLGLPVALAIETAGHVVFGYDTSREVIDAIKARKMRYEEEGAQELLDKSRIETLGLEETVKRADILFVAIQTPHEPEFEGITRLSSDRRGFYYGFLKHAAQEISRIVERLGQPKIVSVISTVLPGTIEREIKPVLSRLVKLCYNPFFIAMGTTIKNFLFPEFVLLGVDDADAAKKVEGFYSTVTAARVFRTNVKTAELIKVAYNVWISSKICVANTLM
jgi:UDPglucose 6-dehydrogenase